MIGQTISHYRIIGQLGSGGMGVVYEAEDLALGRKVALKFLPQELSRDQNALDRFLLEARTASALNHPNICTIYAVEKSGGGDKDGANAQSFIAMELLQGQNLAQKLHAGAMPVDRLLEISIQLADALDAAHAKGIIHRDIKPANIFILNRGTVKVLDFGLAKLTRLATQNDALGATQDAPAHLTSPGATVGTIAYMSPEQARGEELDTRTDLFSLGTVIYEMATGKLPFSGATSALIFNAILERTPTPVQQLNSALPHKLQEIVEKLLEKDLDLRYQSAADLRGDLKRLKRDTESARKAETASQQPPVVVDTAPTPASQKISAAEVRPPSSSAVMAAARRHRVSAGLTIVLVAALLAAAGYGIYALVRKNKPLPFANFTLTKVTDTGNLSMVAISPDGKYILTVVEENGLSTLQLRNLPTNSVTQVQPSANVQYWGLNFSPDGNYLFFVRPDPGNDALAFLYRAPVLGGVPEKLAENLGSDATFAPDGGKLAFMRYDRAKAEYQLIVKNLQDGEEKILTRGPIQNGMGFPAWSPDGKVIAVYLPQPQGALTGIDGIDVQTAKQTPIIHSDKTILFEAEWLPDGSALLGRSRDSSDNYRRWQLVRISYPDGTLTPVTRDVNSYDDFSIAREAGTVAAIASVEHWNVQLVEPSGEPRTLAKAGGEFNFSWASDGRLLTDKDSRLRAVDVNTGVQAMFGADPGMPEFQQSSCPDGRQIFARLTPEDKKISVWTLDANGQNPRRISNGYLDYYPRCSSDGRWLYFVDERTNTVMRMPMEGGTPTKLTELAPTSRGFDLSRGGASLLFFNLTHDTAHKRQLLEAAADTGQLKREIRLQKEPNGLMVSYAPDGKAIDYVVRDNGVDNIWRQPLDGGPGRWETKFKSEQINAFIWSPDGKKLILDRGHTDSDVVLIRESQP